MTKHAIQVFTTKTERGTYLAATNATPYFCVEAASEEELLREIQRVATFYERHLNAPTPVISRDIRVTEFVPTRVIKQELQYA